MAADPPTGPTAWIAVSPDTTYWAGAGPSPSRRRPAHRAPAGTPHGARRRIAAFWAAATGGTVERAAVAGRMVDRALAAQAGVHPELLVSSREPPGRLTLTVEVDDLEARVRWLRDLGARLLQETPGAALVEDPEGNRALLVQRRPDEPGGPVRWSSARRRRS
jgi:catechol 2,3-dioxygenase-like lactoylglutathione lyase family enzyme